MIGNFILCCICTYCICLICEYCRYLTLVFIIVIHIVQSSQLAARVIINDFYLFIYLFINQSISKNTVYKITLSYLFTTYLTEETFLALQCCKFEIESASATQLKHMNASNAMNA